MTYTIIALYRFMPIADVAGMCKNLRAAFVPLGICGSLLVAPEGINGTLAGTDESVRRMVEILKQQCGLEADQYKLSYADARPFNKLKIRAKREIVTFKQPSANPTERVGTYVAPEAWNELISDPEVVVLDTRNIYETRIGTFKNAVVPDIETFTEFAAYVRSALQAPKTKKIAMFCTGGIRCEKASAFMLAEGYQEVYHLKGGILKYLEQVPAAESLWEGDCYVFDKRMAVGHGLTTGRYVMCFSCGAAVDEPARHSPLYEAGVSCPACHATTSPADKDRFRTRQRQRSMLAEQNPTTTVAKATAGPSKDLL